MFAVVPDGKAGISLNVVGRLVFWLAREIREPCPDYDILTSHWHSWSEQFHQHVIQTQRHGPVTLLLPLDLFFRAEHYTLYLFFVISLLAALAKAELSTEQWTSIHTQKIQNKTPFSPFRRVLSFSEPFDSSSLAAEAY